MAGHNYRALEAYSAMSPKDRSNFKFNYDALDLLIDPDYSGAQGKKYQYDGEGFDEETDVRYKDEDDKWVYGNPATYSLPTPLDYTATYNGTSDEKLHNGIKLVKNQEYPRAEFEQLPNEQRHYAPIAVAATGGSYYVVKKTFIHGYEAFAVGTTIDEDKYNELSDNEKENITTLIFSNTGKDQTYYYCREREGYTIGEKGEGVAVTSAAGVTGATGDNYEIGNTVPLGVVIDATQYGNLPNYQKNFTIHGVSPMETSTLYVARYADINDLSTEKIITVIYKYDYEESDETGNHITPVTERHVVNIHINFKSGVPTVEDINPPTIVLPGTGITMRVPSVTPGAYEVTGGGWEIFDNPDDAESHINGVPYTPSVDPLYWYQDGFYLAYYAKTYLGKTYSNHVPISVANYHDLKRVMDDKATHLHVDYDRTRLKRDSKIYINDYSASSENGLDLFKDLYDLSLVKEAGGDGYTVADGKITDVTGTANTNLVGHALLNNSTEEVTMTDGTKIIRGVKAGENLEFILRTDIDHSTKPNPDYNPENPESPERIPAPWTTIGTDDICFKGNLHGDGHTISGLDKSLFYNLCGSVYNLGVTGSFNTAGVADKGTGYVESAWVKTTNGTPVDEVKKPYAVFGAPSDNGGYQVVNSYFWKDNKNLFTTSDNPDVDDDAETITSGGARGTSRAMTAKEFYNGTVAYDLNNFYLYKRYNDGMSTSSGVDYKYWKQGGAKLEMQTGYYANNAGQCSSGWVDADDKAIKYVEERFADGDFVFAAGEIPTAEDERHWVETVTTETATTITDRWSPIWPDDYIFFGQKLTYGWSAEAHQDVPTAVVREDGRLSTSSNANRVYRAPAYYRSKTMGVAHFNPYAVLVAKEKLTDKQIEDNIKAREAYPNMTAIDFTGQNDDLGGGYKLGQQGNKFYPPLLDDGGLSKFFTAELTKNLLAYTGSKGNGTTASEKTATAVGDFLAEPAYAESNPDYRTVDYQSPEYIYGHWIENGVASRDHFLVDKEDFNAPIAYQYASDKRMWYQRQPADDEYVDLKKGWSAISLPFTAELVTTQQKGEITHFYSISGESGNEKIGHEYWLRECTDITKTSADIATATFTCPVSQTADEDKTVTNTFLWDYYYMGVSHEQKDNNNDTYQEYYRNSRKYEGYPLLSGGKPYLLGLPGKTYYEFDLSGEFEAATTAVSNPTKLDPQTITFASVPGAEIGVSDEEMAGVVSNGYAFRPNYLNLELPAAGQSYTLKADNGNNASSFDKVTVDATPVYAFRPYFTSSSSGTRSIIFDYEEPQTKGEAEHGDPTAEELNGGLRIWTKKDKIYVESSLKFTADMRVVTPAGVTVATFSVKPGKTVEVKADFSGMYIVHTLDGKYTKKVTVRK